MMNKRIIRYLIIVFCVIAILFALVKVLMPSKKMNTYLAIGDYLSVSGKLNGEEITSFTSLLGDYFVSNNLINEVNTSYTSSSIDSSLLLEMIVKDAYSGNDSGLVSLIKDSKYITISVGINDIIKYIRFDSSNKEAIYDKEYIKRKLEIMKQNYLEIVEEIKELNEGVSVYLVGYCVPFEYGEDVFELLNEAVKEVSDLTETYYVDISDVNGENNFCDKRQIYLNNTGHEYVFSLFKENYLEG